MFLQHSDFEKIVNTGRTDRRSETSAQKKNDFVFSFPVTLAYFSKITSFLARDSI